jgi:hypothetical protein
MAAGGLPTICNAEPRKAVCDCDAVSSARDCAEGFGQRRGLRAWFQHGLSSDLAVVSEREGKWWVTRDLACEVELFLSYTEEMGGGSFLGRAWQMGDWLRESRGGDRRAFGAQTVKMMSTRVCWRDLTAAEEGGGGRGLLEG